MSKIKNAVAIVTGATGGIGEALCIALAKRGACLAMVARDAQALAALKDRLAVFERPVLSLSSDIAKRDQVKAMRDQVMEEFGRIDILINNAAIGLFQTIGESSEQDIETVLSTNFIGALYCIQEILPTMRRQRRGHIVNVSSVIGRHAIYHQGVYAATKAALDRLSEALYVEEHRHGIMVTLALPDRTETDFAKHALGPQELAILPGGNLRKLRAAEVATGIINSIEKDEVIHYSSWRGKLFSLLSSISPAMMRRLLGYPHD